MLKRIIILLIIVELGIAAFGCSRKVVKSEDAIDEEISVKQASESKTDAEESFPLREKFNKIKHITIEALNREYEKTIIIDHSHQQVCSYTC